MRNSYCNCCGHRVQCSHYPHAVWWSTVETKDVVASVAKHFDALSPKQQEIAQYIVANPNFTTMSTARDLAAQIGVDAATVVRLAQALGFQGYAELRQQLRHRYLGSLAPQALTEGQNPHATGDHVLTAMLRLDLENLRAALDNVEMSVAGKFVEAIQSAGRTLIVASGSYAAPAMVLSHHCQSMGYRVDFEPRGGTALAAQLTALQDDDVLLAISFWRGYRETVQAVEWARAKGIATYAITDSVFSSLAVAAERVLVVPTEGLFYFQSMTAAMSIVYGLIAMLWVRGGEQAEEAMNRMRDLYGKLETFL